MNENCTSQHLGDEISITWLDDPQKYSYLRESIEFLPLRSRFPLAQFTGNKNKRLIGYSNISPKAKSILDGFYRRVWWLKPYDPWKKGHPWEAVIPSSIQAGAESKWA